MKIWYIVIILLCILLILWIPTFVYISLPNSSETDERKYKRQPKSEDLIDLIGGASSDHDFEKVKSRADKNRNDVLQRCGNSNHIPPLNSPLWNDGSYCRYSNCYYFALCYLNQKMHHKIQPGELSYNPKLPAGPKNLAPLSQNEITAEGIEKRVMQDHPTIIKLRDNQAVPCLYYEVGLVVDSVTSNKDYHFYRMTRSGICAHKPGSGHVSLVDASNNYITDGRTANWNFSSHQGPNYTFHCRFAVPHLPGQTYADESHVLDSQLDGSFSTVIEEFNELSENE